jgi:hypothetical protein
VTFPGLLSIETANNQRPLSSLSRLSPCWRAEPTPWLEPRTVRSNIVFTVLQLFMKPHILVTFTGLLYSEIANNQKSHQIFHASRHLTSWTLALDLTHAPSDQLPCSLFFTYSWKPHILVTSTGLLSMETANDQRLLSSLSRLSPRWRAEPTP